jgi:hypothetical protein
MAKTLPSRTLLGTFSGIATRARIYRTDAAIEIDELDSFEVLRRRVFFDDILLITRHREPGLAFVMAMAAGVIACGVLAVIFFHESAIAAAALGIGALAFAAAFVLRLWLQLDVVTIFGRRTNAQLRYWFRKELARRTFDDLAERARAAQQQLAERLAAAAPDVSPSAIELPPSPPAEEIAPSADATAPTDRNAPA